MGVVYKATQLALDRTVALKVVAPELADDEAFRERFKREARLAASLDHPNILPMYEAGEIDGPAVPRRCGSSSGTDLDSLIAAERALAPERAVALVAQVANALDAAHSRGLIHRDVKPGNILIAEEYGQERAYLTDFGLTKNVATGDPPDPDRLHGRNARLRRARAGAGRQRSTVGSTPTRWPACCSRR